MPFSAERKIMALPSDRKYLKTHEWFKLENNFIVMGITDHAADELTDITYVKIPEKGKMIHSGGVITEIESVKATSEIFSGMDGKIVEVNAVLETDPGLINRDPFGQGWIAKLKPSNSSQMEKLLSVEEYQATF
jgi:glycine cleavage system H protein